MYTEEWLAADSSGLDRRKRRRDIILLFSSFGTSVPHRSANMSGAKQRLPLKEKFELMPETLGGQFRKDFPPYLDGLVKSFPHRYVTTPEYAKNAEDIYNLSPRPDDVYISTFPKCGKDDDDLITKLCDVSFLLLSTRYLRMLLYQLKNGNCNVRDDVGAGISVDGRQQL